MCVVSERELTVNKTTWIAGSVSNNVIETVSFNIKQEHIDKVSYIIHNYNYLCCDCYFTVGY